MSSSGASTPRGTLTPPPPSGEGPSPLTVGTRFVKQYYKVLSTTPEQIFRFYQPSSVLSVGVGSQPTQPAVFEVLQQQGQSLTSRFNQEGFEDCTLRFEFEHGAIDAQMSVNGGVLLVVTGHIVYESPNQEEEDDDQAGGNRRKAFVHTFFLGSMTAGTKRSYYVHNDVLRFLHDDEDKTIVASNKTSTVGASDRQDVKLPALIDEPPPKEVVSNEVEPITETVDEVADAPGGGVEESKEPDVHDVLDQKAVNEMMSEDDTSKRAEKENGGAGGGQEESKEELLMDEKTKAPETPSSKPAPGSWASLVAAGKSSGAAPMPSTPSRSVASTGAKQSPQPVAPSSPASVGEHPTTSNATKTDAAHTRTLKRDPDCTLVIKNIDFSTVESDIRGMFDVFATETESRVVGCTVSANRGIAFVDYDSPKPVLAAVDKHKNEPLQLKGRVLDVYQKALEQRNRRAPSGRGGGFRGGGQPGNGRHQYRRSGSGGGGGGRGDRGGAGGRGRSGR